MLTLHLPDFCSAAPENGAWQPCLYGSDLAPFVRPDPSELAAVSIDVAAAKRAFASYRGAPASVRAFVAARYVVAPMGPLAAEFRGLSGTVLSLGSGLSMIERYIAELEPQVSFEGVDLDPAKVELIARTRHLSPRVSLRQGDATRLGSDDGRLYDAVLVCDAIHHFSADVHREVAASVASVVRPGGVVIVKDLDRRPAWKYHWNRIHDRLVAGPEPIHCRPPAEMAGLLEDAGLQVERAARIDHALTPYAHYLIRARRPH
jgi:SAM-dependent methyltransferase